MPELAAHPPPPDPKARRVILPLLAFVAAWLAGAFFPGLSKTMFTCAWIAGVLFAMRLVEVLVWDWLVPRRTGVRVPGLLRQVVMVLLVLAGAVGLLSSVYGFSISALVAASGAVGIVVGLAVKDILSDFFSGIVLNLEQPFRLDDWIAVQQATGVSMGAVREINWRSTRLVNGDGNLLIIRNGELLTATVTNYSQPNLAAEFNAEVSFDFSADHTLIETVLTAAMSEAAASGAILEVPAPTLEIRAIDAQGVHYTIGFSIDLTKTKASTARGLMLAAVARHLRFSGLEPATPSQDVRLGRRPRVDRYDDSSVEHRSRLLDRVELLDSLTDAERAGLAAQLGVRKLKAGETVVQAGAAGSSMFVVAAGLLEVLVASPGVEAPVRVATLGPGDFFGEMSLLTGEARTATVAALVPSVLYEITKGVMARLIANRGELAEELSRIAAERKLRSAATAAVAGQPAEAEVERESLIATISQGIRHFFGRQG